jgi:ribonucleoside-diphosphate reductase alpha subunit
MTITTIIKRNGERVEFDANKLNRWGEWAAGIGVEWSSIVLGATRKCFDGCTSDDLQNSLISECVDRETTPHLRMAGRLFMGSLFKKAYGGHDQIPSVTEMYHRMTALGLWAPMDYTDAELTYFNHFLDHNRDLEANYSEIKQIMDKYAVVDRVAKVYYETPQFVYARMALGNMEKMPKERRMEDVISLYTYLSRKLINAPTPFSINLGTPKKQYASCCVITTEDNIASLSASDHIAYMMTAASAGIGSHIKTRSKGDKVRKGAIIHMGKLPYYKMQQAAVSANIQAARGGANTMHFNVLDPELHDLMKLKNVQTVEQKRIKDIDYSVGANDMFCERVAKNGQWMLVSYGDAPDLYEAMYKGDQTEFRTLFESIENDESIPKTFVKAREIANEFLTEGVETGREYIHFTDEMNRHTPFKDTIYSSNLCQEIGLPTKGYAGVAELYEYASGQGEIGLCSLGAIAANVPDDEYERVAYYTLLMIDNVIEIMEYPFPQLKFTAQARRSVGVGITNLAFHMAKSGMKYSTLEGKQFIHRLAERHSYFLHKGSLRLARERGVCDWMSRTKYPDGWLPIDTANKNIDAVINQPLIYDWESLRKEIVEVGGIRHSVLEAHMPCESSSVGSGHTNSLYPIRSFKVVKTSGTNKTLFIAPEYEVLKQAYELAWNIPTKDMIEVYAVVQKFTGQAISSDLYIKYGKDGKREVSSKQLLTDYLYMKRMGMKTRYYVNSATGVDVGLTEEQEVDDSCEACKL